MDKESWVCVLVSFDDAMESVGKCGLFSEAISARPLISA